MSETTVNDVLNQIATLAPVVAANAREREIANDAEEAAEEALLLKAIALLPADSRQAISSRIQTGNTHSNHAQHERDSYTFFLEGAGTNETQKAVRGVCLTELKESTVGPARDNSGDNDGMYVGTDLFLLCNGNFLQLIYSGTWSKWQGSSSSWEAECNYLTAREVVQKYDLERMLDNLLARLKRHAEGSSLATAAKKRERAEKLQALVKLL